MIKLWAFIEKCLEHKKKILSLPTIGDTIPLAELTQHLTTSKIKNRKMRKIFYEAPELDVLDVVVEAGFLLSVDGTESDYSDGGEGDLMD